MSTREKVLDAGYRIYVSRGLPDFSMRNVAKEVGITATALYRHFGGKDALIEAIAERGFGIFERDLKRVSATGGAPDRVLAILDGYRAFSSRHPALFRLMFSTPRARLRRFPRDFAAHRSGVFDQLRQAVDDGQAAGLFRRDDSLEVSLDLWAYAHGLIALSQAGRFEMRPRAFAELYRRSLKRLLRGLQP
jgi:AcrR family transcriptional regulator